MLRLANFVSVAMHFGANIRDLCDICHIDAILEMAVLDEATHNEVRARWY